MARHVDPDDDSFRRSLLRAAAGGLAALVITFAITGVLANLGGDGGEDSPAVVLTGTPTEEPAVSEAPPPSPELTTPPTSAAPDLATEPTPLETTEAAGTVTVQVLDAVGNGTAAESAAQTLRDLGYEVVVVNPTPRRPGTTTVLYSPGFEDAAEALRDADDRFLDVRPNTAFNESVNLHVLVAPDFQG